MRPPPSTPAAIVSFAAPEDQHLLTQWEKHLRPLQQNGQVTLWSPHHIPPGMNRDEEIATHLAQADILVLLLSADFVGNNECYQLMMRSLEHARHGKARVIPLLLRSVGWHATPLGHLSCLPSNGRPITRWGDRDEAFQDCVDGITRLLRTPGAARQGIVQGHATAVSTPPGRSSAARHHSCFISYSSKDDALAQRLYADLKAHGVDCWFAPHDMKIGARIRPTLDQAIHQHEKLLLLLSEHSIDSAWVEDEVEAALERERTERREMLFPIRLDDAVIRTRQAWAARLRRQVNIGDFSNWTDQEAYQQALERLLRDLENAEK